MRPRVSSWVQHGAGNFRGGGSGRAEDGAAGGGGSVGGEGEAVAEGGGDAMGLGGERESGGEREEEEEDEKVGVVVGDIHDVLGEATESGVRWVGGGRLTCAGGTTTRR